MVSTTVPPIAKTVVMLRLVMKFKVKSYLTQESLDQLLDLPEWNISLRCAQSLNVIFVCFMYCGVMPVLAYAGSVYCAIAYWMDKWCLLRFCRKPPNLTQEVVEQ